MLKVAVMTALLAATIGMLAEDAQGTTEARSLTVLDMPDGPARTLYQSWADQSPMPLPVQIRVVTEQCAPRHLACIDHGAIKLPDLSYLTVGSPDFEMVRTVFLHEVGHLVDLEQRGRGGYRRMFRKMIGRAAMEQGERGWFRIGLIPDVETFADAYAYCSLNPHALLRGEPYMGYGLYRPTDARHAAICHMLTVRLASGHRSPLPLEQPR